MSEFDNMQHLTQGHLVCKLDGTTYNSIEGVHEHIRAFKIKRSAYYEEYYPRYDKISGERIKFKDYEQYFSRMFANKTNLLKWLEANPEAGRAATINWLKRRKKEKGLIYAPSQVELSTLFCPSIPYYNAVFDGGYTKICGDLGFKPRYVDRPISFAPLPRNVTIICDTREQSPLKFDKSVKVVRAKVDAGDYALEGAYDQHVYIERKSLPDLCGTVSKGYDRFKRELDRARKSGSYIVMLVESDIQSAQEFDKDYEFSHIKASPSFIMKRLRDLLVAYPLDFQVVFCDNREEMSRIVLRIFSLGQQVRTMDLQMKYEEGKL